MRIVGSFALSPGVTVDIDSGGREATGTLILKNLSGYELTVRAGAASDIIGAHTYERIDVASLAVWDGLVHVTPQALADNAAQAPSQLLVVTAYAPGEPVGSFYPMSIDRLSNVGNTVATTGSNSLKNDGNSPGTQLIESTPSDQGSSAFNLNNDGSGLWQVLSAGVQRIVAQITRGNAIAGKASIVLGDPGDASLLAVHGTADNATNVGDGASGGYLTVVDSGTSLDLHPTAGANRMLSLSMRDSGGVLRQVFNTSASGATIFFPSVGVQYTGKITSYNGQAATGYGVPLIVAVAENVAIASTVNTLLLTFTPPADGMYRVSGYVQLANGTSGQLILFNVQYRDPALLPTQTIPIYLIPATGGAAAEQQANGSNSFPNGTYTMASLLIRAQNGVAITVRYQDPANTPNDHVSVLLERIS